MNRAYANLIAILKEFASRFTRRLRDWFQQLGEYKQIQLVQAVTASEALRTIYYKFIGDHSLLSLQTQREFLSMKCYSLKRKDLNNHYETMTSRYYLIGGVNEQNLKQVYISSLQEEVQLEIQISILSSKLPKERISIG